MAQDSAIDLKKPATFIDDPIRDILRQGARRLLTAALEAEIETFLKQYKDMLDDNGCQRILRNGYLPEREVQTGIGQIAVKAPRIRDRQPDPCKGKIRFTSTILPPYLRRTKSIETFLPWLYLKGISTGDFTEFATVRLRTAKVRSCFSSLTVLTMAFQLCRCAQKRWIRLHHPERLAEVIRGVKFVDGIIENRIAAGTF
jgi:transposase-like protein